jgi:thiol:disulfide interchange protein
MNNNKLADNHFHTIQSKIAKIALLSFVVIASFSINATAQKSTAASKQSTKDAVGIKFTEDSWSNTLKQAAKEHKHIFVDAYATWCGPCKQLRATTFKDKNAATFFNENFVNVSFDVEKGEGPELADQWKIQGLPTLLVFDEHGKQLTRSVGYIGAKDLVGFGKKSIAKK